MKPDTGFREISVRIAKRLDGSAVATVWVRLRGGDLYPAIHHQWTSGAPTPAQLELFTAGALEEVQTLVLSFTGVQGVLAPSLDAGGLLEAIREPE